MAELKELELKPSYRKGEQNIGEEFYTACMLRSSLYDRAMGFFSSTIYSIVWPAMKEFVLNGGMIRIVCSPILSKNDEDALKSGYSEKQYKEFSEKLNKELANLLDDPDLNKPTRALALLVALGVLDLKIAFILNESGVTYNQLFHDKVGIFTDQKGNAVVFKGSMNETWSGLSPDGNLESIDVFPSWVGGRDGVRAEENITFFNSLWHDKYRGVRVKNFPEAAREKLIRIAKDENLDALLNEINSSLRGAKTADKQGRRKLEPLPHQLKALEAWINAGFKGILEHATGSGKTLTAILAIREHIQKGFVALILVPSKILLAQWEAELKREIPEAPILKAGSSNYRWMKNDRLRRFTYEDQSLGPRLVLATMQTARSQKFIKRISKGRHLMIVADEVHQMGSRENQNIMTLAAGPRLGLSATPARYLDEEGTEKILDFFGPVLQPVFTLQDSIRCGRLVEYEYYPHAVELSDREATKYSQLTREIAAEIAKLKKKSDERIILTERIKLLLIARARIVKKAEAKLVATIDILKRHFEQGQRWLLYCEDAQQLKLLLEKIRELDIDAGEYHTGMESSQEESLRWFRTFGGVLVSIRCLDEGVDIPSVTHALILSSSQNPRQFIQRRGRILRRTPGKSIAVIYDLLVIPLHKNDEPDTIATLKSELARALEFAKTARNQWALTEIRRFIIEAGFEPDILINYGFEEGVIK